MHKSTTNFPQPQKNMVQKLFLPWKYPEILFF
jgi:hypothetical protein